MGGFKVLFKNITVIDENYEARLNYYLAVKGNTIEYIGPERPFGDWGEEYDGSRKAAMPGYFNIHCHVPMTLLRGFGEGLPLDRWLKERVFPFEALLTGEEMYWGAMLGIAEMLKSGAVSFTDMYMELPDLCRAVEESGIKANLSNGTTGFSPDDRFKDGKAYRELKYMMEYTAAQSHDRIIADASLHAEYTSHELLVRDVAEFAKENGLRLHLHLSETKNEHEECKLRRNGMTPAQWFRHCGVLDVPVTAAHCVWVENEDMEIMANHGVTAAHCPTSNLKLGSGIAQVQAMLQKGIHVGIGTDGASSNNNLNVHEEVNLASLLQKGILRDPSAMNPQETLRAACLNGALSQGRKDCGCLKAGNRADIVVYDMDKPHLQPAFDVLSNILFSAQSDDIVLNMVDGKTLYRDGELTTIDLEQVKYHVNHIARQRGSQLGV